MLNKLTKNAINVRLRKTNLGLTGNNIKIFLNISTLNSYERLTLLALLR